MRRALASLLALAALPVAIASAADMPVKAPPPAPAPTPVFTWTGLYIGGISGYASMERQTTRNIADALYPVGFSDTNRMDGGLFGFEAGANYQFNWAVIGIEGDWQGATIGDTFVTHSPIVGGAFTDEVRSLDWVSTLTGRLGLAWDRWMLYGKGGAAWAATDDSASNASFTGSGVLITDRSVPSRTLTGYVVGGGIEWAPSWWGDGFVTARIEGDWYNFGSRDSEPETCLGGTSCVVGSQTLPGESTTKTTMWEIKSGVDIRFNSFLH
jgi:outer membrane immunogenic protein